MILFLDQGNYTIFFIDSNIIIYNFEFINIMMHYYIDLPEDAARDACETLIFLNK